MVFMAWKNHIGLESPDSYTFWLELLVVGDLLGLHLNSWQQMSILLEKIVTLEVDIMELYPIEVLSPNPILLQFPPPLRILKHFPNWSGQPYFWPP